MDCVAGGTGGAEAVGEAGSGPTAARARHDSGQVSVIASDLGYRV